MQCIIFSEEYCQPENLFPFTLTRRIQDIRIGILTIREKWEKILGLPSFDKWEGDYKEGTRSIRIDGGLEEGNYLLVHANILPTETLAKAIMALSPGELLMHPESGAIAFHFSSGDVSSLHRIKVRQTTNYDKEVHCLKAPWEIFMKNDIALRLDFELLTKGRKSVPVSASNQVIGKENIFIEAGAVVENSIINASSGPVYFGANALVMEGCMIRGSLALLPNAVLKMGSKVYGATTIGPGCIAGGEIKNSVMMGYSNKAHDGYLGDAVIGEWCNLGAGTTASNVKNNAGEVYVYHPTSDGGRGKAGIKCGLMMGDYSRSAINTSFNTGTVIGVSSSVFGSGLLPKYIPNFSWGADGIRKYDFDLALRDIRNWKGLKDAEISRREEHILKYIYDNY
ncbi:putative sugar nucleotidyl transferase [Flavihumibacter profundi]|uniref:putative sugar nucleotidyl transferase n=1 Tax=Flavihumibacter profundi TaxID=2716883 RepID=UPI001CC508D8|nr:putative sugar nucleotidyl transferase [Flavihumibacter profundi]MBZ5856243.1 glucose-1-phosphate thymidylyltransferase [Flavihumibacter profundi]